MYNLFNKIKLYSERNGQSFFQAITKRYLAALYTHPTIRKAVSPFFTTRKPHRWIFLVGCYNSGTTICRDVLGTHPDISTLPREGVRFTTLLPRPEEKGWKRMWVGCPSHMEMPTENSEQIVEKIIKDWSPWWKKDATAFLEKSITNTTRMEWLDDNFENAFFLGITRNAYPVIEGIRRRASPEGEAKETLGTESYPIDLVGKQWNDANGRLIASGRNVKNFHLIKYEDLVADPVNTLRGIWDFLKIEPVNTTFNGNILTIGERQITLKNMNAKSIARLSSNDIASLNPVINDIQNHFGYELISEQSEINTQND